MQGIFSLRFHSIFWFSSPPGLPVDHSQLSSLVLKSPLGLNPAFPVNLNAAGQGLSPLLSPVLSDAGGARIEEDDEMKRKVRPWRCRECT